MTGAKTAPKDFQNLSGLAFQRVRDTCSEAFGENQHVPALGRFVVNRIHCFVDDEQAKPAGWAACKHATQIGCFGFVRFKGTTKVGNSDNHLR